MFLENARKSNFFNQNFLLKNTEYKFFRCSQLCRFENHPVTVPGVVLSLAGEENFVTSANCILAVFMEPVANHGSATVNLSGEDCCVMQVMRTSDLQLPVSFNGRFGFTSFL